MKASIVAVSLLSAVAFALPEPAAEAHAPAHYGDKYGKKPKDACPKKDKKKKGFPIPFTSTYSVKATPEQVVSGPAGEEEFTGGLPGALGFYDLGINTDLDLICYYIKLVDFQGEYESPANTATHIHEAGLGLFGPPRIAFPNPEPVEGTNIRISAGCLSGPFETGLINNATGQDQGAGFTVAQIEANPAGFNADVHSSLAVPGAVRGQLS